MHINGNSNFVGARGPLVPTKVGILEQDPSVSQVQMETVTLSMSHDPQPKTKDYKCTDTVPQDANGNYVFDPAKEPEKFGPVNILGNLQTGLDTFLSYCDQDKIPSTWFKVGPFSTTQLSIYAFDRKDEPNAFLQPDALSGQRQARDARRSFRCLHRPQGQRVGLRGRFR